MNYIVVKSCGVKVLLLYKEDDSEGLGGVCLGGQQSCD